ncbi:hypothetical protein DY000_02048525 [Brassica cretica]|uniref:Uncharacterized protein n=1 Tax=Brassica cretica TaxID=69181 RepID=A0ABQ7FCB7_BRACR|nr:hypothetical protein DY000_02048525 [Brassica cretica]
MDADLCPIFDEEDDHLDEDLGPTFDEKALSITSIIMENQLCFDTGTTPTPCSQTFKSTKSPRVETDFWDSVLKLDILCFETDRPWHMLRSLLNKCVVLSFDDIVVDNTFFEKHIEHLISDSQSELTLLCSDFEKDRHVLTMFNIILCLDTIMDKQVQSPRSVRNRSIGRAYQSEIWRCMYSRKMASKLQGSKMDLRSNPFQEGGNYAPRIVDPGQDSEVRVDELDELCELSDTNLELDELSDTILELSELSDTENGIGLAAGRNEP